MRPIIRFLDDEIDTPSNLIEPVHDPLVSAFIPYSTGFLVNEMKSYMEWMSYQGGFSWMNAEWDDVADIYSYWPFLRNSAGSPMDLYYFAYTPSVVCALVRVVDDTFQVEGVVVLTDPPDLELAGHIEEKYPEQGITRLNMSVVPLEIVDVPEDILESVVYYWVNTLRTLNWGASAYRMDSLVYWSSLVREHINNLIEKKPTDLLRSPDHITPTISDVLKIHGLVSDQPTYFDPLSSSAFMGDLRKQLPELPLGITIQDIHYFLRTGIYPYDIDTDPGIAYKLNAILCKYPDEVQERLFSGVGTSLDPRDIDKIGAGFRNGRRPNRAGRVLLTFEDLRQPRP